MHPAKAVGRNEVPFGRDTCATLNNIVLDSGLGPPHRRGNLDGRNLEFVVMLPISKLLCPLFTSLSLQTIFRRVLFIIKQV